MKTKQISKTNEPSKWHILFIGIVALILALPVYFVMCVKDFFKNKKRNTRTLSNIKLSEKHVNAPLMPYKEPISRSIIVNSFLESMSLSVFNLKNLTDSVEEQNYQFLASDSHELKEHVLYFLAEHPIENLLCGNVNCNGYDMDHWEIRIIFEDQNLNRCIRGYGITEASAPFLCELVPYLVRTRH